MTSVRIRGRRWRSSTLTYGGFMSCLDRRDFCSPSKKRRGSIRNHLPRFLSVLPRKRLSSWIQDQLQSHPDELWQDGVQDYLNHTKSIVGIGGVGSVVTVMRQGVVSVLAGVYYR